MKFEQNWPRGSRLEVVWNSEHFSHPHLKNVKCQCTIITLATLVDLRFLMIYAKIQPQGILGFGEDFQRFFPYKCIGKQTWPCCKKVKCQYTTFILAILVDPPHARWFKQRFSHDQTDLQCQAARHCHHQVQWATCAAWHWGSGPHSEGEKTSMVWTCGTLQWCNQDSLWHTGWWKAWAWHAKNDMEAADREGLQRVEALGYQPSW